MPGCELLTSDRRGRSEISLSGTFDGSSAWELSRQLAETHGEMVIDFTHAASINDYALAVLSQTLHDQRSRGARLLGLRHHQLRMLRYLGIEVSEDGLVAPIAERTPLPELTLSVA